MGPRIVIPAVLLMILSACSVSSKTEKQAIGFEKTKTLIESGNYKFTVRSVTPIGGKTIQLTTPYSLEARAGIYQAYLPYYGRAYQADLGGDGGIEFEGEPEDLTVTGNSQKGTVTVKFVMRTSNDRFDVMLVAGSGGYGSLNIASQRRQAISYYGLVGELSEK